MLVQNKMSTDTKISMDNNTLTTFKAICNFVNELANAFGAKHKSLRLYRSLINKTQIVHDTAIKKHVDVVRSFCVANRGGILSQDVTKIALKIISYSDRVYINIAHLLSIADPETKAVI